jgi:hypothetical protein
MDHSARAREIVDRLLNTTDDFNVDDVAAALRAVERETLERAAQVADDFEDNGRDDYSAGAEYGARRVADAIRALMTEGEKVEPSTT